MNKNLQPSPYAQFNFQLSLGGEVLGGFQELSAIEKLHGLNKASDVILKRGVINAPALNDWLDEVRKHGGSHRAVKIELLDETRRTVTRWLLHGARPIKHTFGEDNPSGVEVAIEELVLACERFESDDK